MTVATTIRVLLVDDRPENLTALQGLLEGLGVDFSLATSGNEALRLTLRQDFALVLLDVQMPDMDGFETAELMRANPKTRHLPIIFVTAGMNDLSFQFKGYEAGAVDFLTKPIEPAILRSKVRIFSELYQQRCELEQHRHFLAELVEARTVELRRLNEELEWRVAERTAQLELTNRELESFSYSVSHDLRAPLRHMCGFSRILLEEFADGLQGEATACLQRISGACSRMERLIDALLTLSRISRAEKYDRVIDLGSIACGVIGELRQGNPERSVQVSIVDGVKAFGDPELMRVVLQNLLDNAWKYTTHTDTPRIEFGTVVHDGETAYYVKDNGAGFDMAYIDKLFAPFQRLHGAEFEGTGIGLATVQRIIHRHGGRVWAEGVPAAGATFHFTLGRQRPS